jgi:hypothetical protein
MDVYFHTINEFYYLQYCPHLQVDYQGGSYKSLVDYQGGNFKTQDIVVLIKDASM